MIITQDLLRDAAKWALELGPVTQGGDWITFTDEQGDVTSADPQCIVDWLREDAKPCGVCIGGAVIWAALQNDVDTYQPVSCLTALTHAAAFQLDERGADPGIAETPFSDAIEVYGTQYMVDVLLTAAEWLGDGEVNTEYHEYIPRPVREEIAA